MADSSAGIPQSMTPSGVGLTSGQSQVNGPMGAIRGFNEQSNQNAPTGTDRNSQQAPAIYRWNKYDFMYNAYFSMGGFYDGTALWKSMIEKDDQYIERRAVSYYRNFVRSIIDATYVPVFTDPATRETKKEETIDEDGKIFPVWNAFMDDVDGRDSDIQKFTEKIIRYSRILGVSFIVMDNYPNVFQNTETAIADRTFPFVYMRLPQQVEESLLVLDDFCNIVQIAFAEMPEKVKDINGIVKEERRWKLWTKDYSVFLRKDDTTGEFVEIGQTRVDYRLEKVPVYPLLSSECEDNTILPHPNFYDVARTNWAIYNVDSAQMRLIRSQMFAILCTPNVEGGFASGPLAGLQLPASTPDNTFPLPFYLAPPTGPYAEVSATLEALREDLYRLASQEGITGVKQAKSGVAKAYDFSAQDWVLKKTVVMAQRCEDVIARFFKMYVPSENFDYCVTYNADFKPEDKQNDSQLYSSYLSEDPGTEGRKLALKKMTQLVFGDVAEDEELTAVYDDIDATAKLEKEQKVLGPTENEMLGLDENGKPLDKSDPNANPNPGAKMDKADKLVKFVQDGKKVPG